jgi:uncharacterized protein (TIGR02217 family)
MPPVLPELAGQGWSVHKRPVFATRVAAHISGREIRAPNFSYPLYEFELTYEGLASNSAYPGVGDNSLQALMGLYLQCKGQFGTFLYVDPSDHSVTAQAIAIADGTTTTFTFARTLGTYIEPVSWVTGIGHVYLNGIDQDTGWSLTEPNALTFSSPPATGAVITADFSFAYECRFLEDLADFENFMTDLWRVESLKFRSVRS